MRENPIFRSGRLSVDYDHVETRGVLAGAYRARHHDAEEPVYLTHLVFVGPPPRHSDLRTGCRQPVDNMGDAYGVSLAESAERPTCPTCAKKWEKIPAEFRGARESSREPNASSERLIFRELRKAATRVEPWKPASSKAYIVDVAHEAGVEVSEAAPVLLALQRVMPDLLSRIDLVSAADSRKLRQSTLEDGRFGGLQLLDLDVLKHASFPKALVPNGGYYVWVIGKDGQPLLEGPYGPHDLGRAKALARIGATEGEHDRAVSVGVKPTAESFEFVRQYKAGSGERVL